ncbi:substrate-binding domain-containing protein [Actinoplanes regularis]|uniref:substrate-binding domain-containing protein n=1 Tax=Actinoplanes regularis TaxID=52697 RepID=UPI0024A5567C|nr:substrate-binding domain-containing protein [Actinoplanes regularis]GLW30822.1 hypothetical protein Areg01_37620 [Actinoplanes regularis]
MLQTIADRVGVSRMTVSNAFSRSDQPDDHPAHLVHRRIAYVLVGAHGQHGLISDPSVLTEGYSSVQRRLSWDDVLRPASIEPLIIREPFEQVDAIRRDARELLSRPGRPTVVLSFPDVTAVGIYQAADDLGPHIPEDLSVTGFDDGPTATQLRPALTTVRQEVEEKGRAAAASLTATLQSTRDGIPSPTPQTLLPATLAVRVSTGIAPR